MGADGALGADLPPGNGSSTSTILVVDDNLELLHLITETLTMLSDYRVVTATSGDAGLARLFEEHPACMVIDVRMPGLDGLQLVRAIRGDPETAAMPLIILTALPQESFQFEGRASGADEYLLKSVKPQALLAAIQRALATTPEFRDRAMRALVDATEDETEPRPY